MPNKYNEAISKIELDEKKKEEIIKNLKEKRYENKNVRNKGKIIMFKIKKTLTTIAAIAGITICGGVAYAGISGKLHFFNNKIDTEYENYAEEITGKYVEDKYSKITLNSIACDDAYLILNYTIDVKEEGKEIFNKIKSDNATGFELILYNDITIDGQTIEKYGDFSQQVSRKITDTKAEIYEIVDLTGMDVKDKFNLKISDFKWCEEKTAYLKEKKDNSLSINVSKKEAKKNTNIIMPKEKGYEYKDLKLSVEKIVKTPFETFAIIQTEEQNVSSDRFPSNRDEEMIDLNLEIIDENSQRLKVDQKSIVRLKYEDGTYDKDDEGNIENLNYSKPRHKFKNATIYGYYVIALGDKIENANSFTIKPYYSKFVDNGVAEEKYISSLEWYDVKNEKRVINQGTDQSVQINKVEINNNRILFYYTTQNPNLDPSFYVRNKERAFNYFYTDIKTNQTPSGEYITGIRIKDNESAGMYTYEKGDNDENANLEKYSAEAFLSDTSKLIYTVDLGSMFEKEFLGEGLTINLNK